MQLCLPAFAGLLWAVSLASAQDAPADADTVSGQCLVRVSCRPEILALSPGLVEALFQSSATIQAAADGLFVAPLIESDLEISFFALSSQENTLVGQVRVRAQRRALSRPPPSAMVEFLRRLCDGVRAAIERAGDLSRRDAQMSEARLAQQTVRQCDGLEEAVAALGRRRSEILSAAGRTDLAHHRVLDMARAYEDQQRAIELELAGVLASRDALEQHAVQLARQIEQTAKSGAVIDELTKVVELRRADLAVAEKVVKQGVASDAELRDKQEKLALASAELAREQQSAAAAAGADQVSSINGQLIGLSVRVAELRARLQHVETERAAIRERGLLEQSMAFERVSEELGDASNALRDARARVESLKGQAFAAEAPSVEALDLPAKSDHP